MVGTPHNGHSKYMDPGWQPRMVATIHDGYSRCADLRTQHRDCGDPS
ncbi:unnamed protein product [Staurois parvus]|uniref:Uncharacterized protein n=1 Tax=Staurois parvus TaxID=386267 RepID=A0ABN9C9E3_9NEOB|nr:unnamed protein product [Staurois parvus]